MKKLCFVLAFVMAALLAVCVFADSEEETRILSYSVDGYVGDETRLFSPDDSFGRGFYKFDLPEEAWSVTGEGENVRRRTYDDITMGCVYMKEKYGGSEGMTLAMDLRYDGVNIEEYNVLGFGIGVIGGYNNNSAYSVELEFVTTENTYRSTFRIGQDDELCYWSMIYTDISSVKGYTVRINVSIKFDGETMPTQIRVSSPFLSVRTYPGFEMAERYLVSSMKNDVGRFVGATGVVIPAEGDVANIRGSIVTKQPLAENSTVYFRIVLDGLISGRMTFGINYTNPAKHESFRSGKLTVDGENVFIIPVQLDGEAFEYSLSFEGIECERTFKITSVELLSDGQSVIAADTKVGALDEITRKGNAVKFSGTINREAAKKYSGASIVFYALRDEYSDSLDTAVEIGRIKVSTRFDYTADLTAYPASADTFKFMAAIVQGGRIIPLSTPEYCNPSEPSDSNVTGVGLANAAAAGAFESNVSHIIVDIPLTELMSVSGDEATLPLNYTVYSGDSNTGDAKEIMLSRAVLDELDRDINFYISVGIKVYLRFTATSPLEGLTYTGEATNYAICADSDEASAVYASFVRFFSSRYSSIGGFVLGKGVNDRGLTGYVGEDILGYSHSLARLAGITYNAAAPYHPNMTVIIPFGEPVEITAEESLNESSDELISVPNEPRPIDTDLLAVMLASSIEQNGGIPWTLMYCIDNSEDDVTPADRIVDRLTAVDVSRPYSMMYLYRPIFSETVLDYIAKNSGDVAGTNEHAHIDYAAGLFVWLCERLSGEHIVFMEFDETPIKTSRNFYSSLKSSSESEGYIHESVALPDDGIGDGAIYSVWNFSDQYHTQGWLGGGGVASCLTGYSSIKDNGSRRVLKTQLASAGDGGAGVTLGNLDRTVDMSLVDKLRFTFAVTSADGSELLSNTSVVFVVGSGDHRAEYYAEDITNDTLESFTCDLSEYENRNAVDYIGVMIYADEDICFELGSVEAISYGLDADALSDVFVGSGTVDEDSQRNLSVLFAAAIITAVVSAVVIILLVRRDREERESAERAKAEAESKNKRSFYERYRQQK